MTQKPLIIITAFFCLSISGLITVNAEKIYKWTESKGNVHYSDRPHESHPPEKVKIEPGPGDQARTAAQKNMMQSSPEKTPKQPKNYRDRISITTLTHATPYSPIRPSSHDPLSLCHYPLVNTRPREMKSKLHPDNHL